MNKNMEQTPSYPLQTKRRILVTDTLFPQLRLCYLSRLMKSISYRVSAFLLHESRCHRASKKFVGIYTFNWKMLFIEVMVFSW